MERLDRQRKQQIFALNFFLLNYIKGIFLGTKGFLTVIEPNRMIKNCQKASQGIIVPGFPGGLAGAS